MVVSSPGNGDTKMNYQGRRLAVAVAVAVIVDFADEVV